MRTLWIAMCVAAAVGCGGAVSDEGAVDANGCPIDAAGWSGTGSLSSGCDGAPTSVSINGGSYDSLSRPWVQTHSYDGLSGSCQAYVVVNVSCGDAGYSLSILPR